jgi:hypothetical protein
VDDVKDEPDRPGQASIHYLCSGCRRIFAVPAGSPAQMEGLAIDGLTCPWCGRWAMPVRDDILEPPPADPELRKGIRWVVGALLVTLLGVVGYVTWMDREREDDDRAETVAELEASKVSLEQALALVEGHGTPIAAGLDVEEKGSQISIRMVTGPAFSEVLVDTETGRIVKTAPITGSNALSTAEAEATVMGKASVSLRAAVARAVKAHAGARAVRITPRLREGLPTAEITLANDRKFETVAEKLH